VTAETLRDAAALIEATAAAIPAAHRDTWRLSRVRNTLVPWVALMGPDVAAPLASILRWSAFELDHGDETDRHEDQVALARTILGETP
jgi:hypothetical protein